MLSIGFKSSFYHLRTEFVDADIPLNPIALRKTGANPHQPKGSEYSLVCINKKYKLLISFSGGQWDLEVCQHLQIQF